MAWSMLAFRDLSLVLFIPSINQGFSLASSAGTDPAQSIHTSVWNPRFAGMACLPASSLSLLGSAILRSGHGGPWAPPGTQPPCPRSAIGGLSRSEKFLPLARIRKYARKTRAYRQAYREGKPNSLADVERLIKGYKSHRAADCFDKAFCHSEHI